MKNKTSQRQLLREKRKAQKRRTIYISFAVILGTAVIFGSIVFLSKYLSKPANYETSEGFTLGDPEAPVEVIAFSNYSCSFCKIYSETIEKDLISGYVDPGEIYYRYVNLANSDEDSANAAEASYCAAEQNKFFEYKSYLYTYAMAGDGFSLENLTKYARLANLDTENFGKCMSENQYAEAYIQDRSYAQSAGIRATPTFLVNGQLVNANELISTIDGVLGK